MSLSIERLKELHEAARYADSHGNGLVSVTAAELQELLPALPEEHRTPTHLELMAKDMQEKEATRKAAEPAGPVAVAEAGGDPAKAEPEPTAAQLGAAVRQIPGNEPLVNVPAETVTASSDPKPAA